MTQAHPKFEHLEGYANGALSEGMSLLVAAHLTYCPDCRKEIVGIERLGAALMMASDTPAEVSPPSLDACLASLDSPVEEHAVTEDPHGVLPMPLRRALPASLDEANWQFRMPGLHGYVLADYEGEHVRLLRARPGVSIFHHTHEGEEATLILSGEMEDGDHVFRRGDVSLADETHKHKPKIIGDEVCYCLVVMSGSLRFTGPVGLALNLFTR